MCGPCVRSCFNLCLGNTGHKNIPNKLTSLRKIEGIQLEALSAEKCKSGATVAARELWTEQVCLFLLIRRPGESTCRAHARSVWKHWDEFTDLGVRLVCVVNENIPGEVEAFKEFWGGDIFLDGRKSFFKALWGGRLAKGGLVGLVANPRVLSHQFTAMTRNRVPGNLVGNGLVKGGVYIIGPGDNGVLYQFREVTFGDQPTIEALLEVCEGFAYQTPGDHLSIPPTPSVYLSPVEALSVPPSPAPVRAFHGSLSDDKLET
ncbi:hypothetical protein KFL_000420160 [Klebsormidium nitens]|uniref:Peroxiredoxin-like 2A n=1 Tax=Klebsormidium nitens TaxID=105231 RepID=A0A1Y1HMU8_KLENI|nr:hypothetical protein KFL_000420160 [Klebsormidium nitens]|eukprot:GAQ79944.1 hypothetical protein KFL_000420160 [Klebsormidium nitens]